MGIAHVHQHLPPIEIQNIGYKEASLEYYVKVHHEISMYQWYCVVRGNVDMTVDKEVYSLDSEDSILIPANCPRSPRCRDKAPGYVVAKFINHKLKLKALENKVVSIPSNLRDDFYDLITELQKHPGSNTNALTDALLTRIVIVLHRSVIRSPHQDSKKPCFLNVSHYDDIIIRAEVFMQHNLHRHLSRQAIAKSVFLSPPHLARIFRANIGKTIIERLTELRIERAKNLLLETTMQITQISFDIGYNSFSHFCKLFKHQMGVRPSDYRRTKGHIWR